MVMQNIPYVHEYNLNEKNVTSINNTHALKPINRNQQFEAKSGIPLHYVAECFYTPNSTYNTVP
jgi:hypothetical protein